MIEVLIYYLESDTNKSLYYLGIKDHLDSSHDVVICCAESVELLYSTAFDLVHTIHKLNLLASAAQ